MDTARYIYVETGIKLLVILTIQITISFYFTCFILGLCCYSLYLFLYYIDVSNVVDFGLTQ